MALGTRASAAIGAAVAASALIALLFLGGRERGGATAPPVEKSRPAPEAPAAAAPMTREEAAAPSAADPAPPEPPLPPEGPSVELRVLLDQVQPVPGCLIMGAGRNSEGEYVTDHDDDLADPGVTDGQGTFVLRWVTEPKERLLTVSHSRHPKFERVEGATQVGALKNGQRVFLAGTGPVGVHLDGRGLPRVRILDDATGLALPPEIGAVLEYSLPGAADETPSAAARHPMKHEAGGWWSLREVPDEAVAPRVRAAGFRDAPLDAGDGKGRRTVRLRASGSGVKGFLETPASASVLSAVSIRRVGSRVALGSPTFARVQSGNFLVDGLEKGEWEIDARWRRAGDSSGSDAWTVRRFEYGGGLLDLGTLHAAPGVSLGIRWASPIALPEGASFDLRPGREDAIADGYEGVRRGSMEVGPDENGVCLFRGLRPGGRYRLSCAAFPGYEETVHAPVEPGAEGAHEAGRDLRLTKCRLSFTVDGKKPEAPVSLDGPFRKEQFDPVRSMLEAHLVPGRHRFYARIGNESDRHRHPHEVEVEVPDAAEYEATVDVKTK